MCVSPGVPCRRGLACELLGRFEESLDLLSTVKEWQAAAGAQPDPQLSADMVRVSQRIQDQKQQQQEQAAAAQPADEAAAGAGVGAGVAAKPLLPGAAAAAVDSVGSDGDSDSTDAETDADEEVTLQQQQPHITWDPTQAYAAAAGSGSGSWEFLGEGEDGGSGSASPAVSPSRFGPGLGQRGSSGSSPIATGSPDQAASSQSGGQQSLGDVLRAVHAEEAARQQVQQDSGARDGGRESMPDVVQLSDLQELAEQAASLQQLLQQREAQAPQQKVQQKVQKQKPEDEIQSALKKLQQAQANLARSQQQKLLATAAEREQGNAAFKAGQYQAALKHYNAALQAEPQDIRAYSNRAQVRKTGTGQKGGR